MGWQVRGTRARLIALGRPREWVAVVQGMGQRQRWAMG